MFLTLSNPICGTALTSHIIHSVSNQEFLISSIIKSIPQISKLKSLATSNASFRLSGCTSSFEVSTTFEIKILLQINIDSINIQVDLNDSNAT